ncbi:MAG: ABC transporter permease [Clostridiales bacterium]|nr:ABC transporter permease [Clostridiales bacterium]
MQAEEIVKADNIEVEKLKKRSQWKDVWKRLRRNKLAMAALFVVIILILTSIFAEFLAPYDFAKQNFSERFQMPNARHLLGTDDFGRDLLSRIIFGGRISLLVALMAVSMALVVGGFFGATAGYFAGRYDGIVMRLMDVLMAIPGFLLAVSISAALGTGIQNTALAIAVGAVPSYARIIRSVVLTIREQEFVEAARATGAGHMRIIFYHIIPNTLSPIIVESTLRIGASILMISGLSFIGLGVQPPTPEWGSILATGREYIRDFWPIVTFPGLAIMLTLFGFNLLGDGLRDALDPRLKL